MIVQRQELYQSLHQARRIDDLLYGRALLDAEQLAQRGGALEHDGRIVVSKDLAAGILDSVVKGPAGVKQSSVLTLSCGLCCSGVCRPLNVTPCAASVLFTPFQPLTPLSYWVGKSAFGSDTLRRLGASCRAHLLGVPASACKPHREVRREHVAEITPADVAVARCRLGNRRLRASPLNQTLLALVLPRRYNVVLALASAILSTDPFLE